MVPAHKIPALTDTQKAIASLPVTYKDLRSIASHSSVDEYYDMGNLNTPDLMHVLGMGRVQLTTSGETERLPKTCARLIVRLLRDYPMRIPPGVLSYSYLKQRFDRYRKESRADYTAILLGMARSRFSDQHLHLTSGITSAYATTLLNAAEVDGDLSFGWELYYTEMALRGIEPVVSPEKTITPHAAHDVFERSITGKSIKELLETLPVLNSARNLRFLLKKSKPGLEALLNIAEPDEIPLRIALIVRALISRPELLPLPPENSSSELKKTALEEGYSIKEIIIALGRSGINPLNFEAPGRSTLHLSYLVLEGIRMFGRNFLPHYIKHIVDVDAQSIGYAPGEIMKTLCWSK